jgi:predicted nucleotidyltransferase
MALLDELKCVLERYAEIRLAVVFGSVARGDVRASNDLDLALLLSPDTQDMPQKIEAELAAASGREVDFVHLDTAPPLLRFEVARDGVLLRGDHDDWVDFRTRAMIDWWDWAPTARIIEETVIQRLREKLRKSAAQSTHVMGGSSAEGGVRRSAAYRGLGTAHWRRG